MELGSNAVRLLVARLGPGVGFEVLEEKRVQTRLGSGRPGVLQADSIARTVAAVHQFLARARRDRDPRVIAVATAAVRDASNRERLLGPLRRRDGVEVRILSGREEARLGALAVQSSLHLEDGLVADLGGGSLQLTRLRKGHVASTVGRADRRGADDASASCAATRPSRASFESSGPRCAPASPRRSRRRSGARRSWPSGAPCGPWRASTSPPEGEEHRSRHGLRLQQPDVTRIRVRLESLPIRKRRQVPGLRAERADIIVAGAIVIEELMTFGGYYGLTICKQGVRDALLLRETFAEEG